jgi:serine/threonine-protein kinase RsbW
MTKISKPETAVPEKEPTIRLMHSSEAELLLDLLRRCYQDSYFDSLYYDTKALAEAVENCQQYSMVAVNSEGEFVAHVALRNFQNSLTADTSMAIVDPRYRSNGLFVKMGAEMMPVYEQLGLCGLYLQAVTVHPHSQSSSLKGHAGVTGVYLNYIPANTQFLAMEAAVKSDAENAEATPVVIMVQPLGVMPTRSIVWPAYYRSQIETAFEQCNMQRDTASAQKLAKHTLIRIDKKPRQKIINLWLDEIGDDWQSEFKAALKNLDADLECSDYRVIYLQLPLNKYLLDELIEVAKAQGFFYAGVLPEYGKQDWLGMQKLDRSSVDPNSFYLVGDQSKQIFEFIMQD